MRVDAESFQFIAEVGGLALGMAASIWALAERHATRKVRDSLNGSAARARAAIALRDALIAEGREAFVTWDRQGAMTFCHCDGDAKLRACLDGPEAALLSAALERLHSAGQGFALRAEDIEGRCYSVRGRTIGGTAAVWLERESDAVPQSAQLRALFDAVPVPMWLRDTALTLRWANRAFLNVVGEESLESARANGAAFDKSEPDSAAAALAGGVPREGERYALIDGQWRTFALLHIPLDEGRVAGAAIDVSEEAEAETLLKRHRDAQAHLLDRLTSSVAVFGPERRLEAYNSGFAKMWDLPAAWLDCRPTHDDLLDRLREERKLPERRDYQTWKRKRQELFADANGRIEEMWQVPGGKTLRVSGYSNPLGGATFLCEDATEKFALESSLKTLVEVQAATLDVLGEAVAAFGPDGRLALHNAAFAEIWTLDRAMLADKPHIREVAAACLAKFGDEAMWERLVATVSSGPAQRRNWRKIRRSDGSVLSLATVPLPDRATLVTFADVTDEFRIGTALSERNEAFEMLDRLRADYIKQVSYELRTPLNTILGFAEHLAADARGTLNAHQRGSLEAIVAGAYALKTVADGLLAGLVESKPPARCREEAPSLAPGALDALEDPAPRIERRGTGS